MKTIAALACLLPFSVLAEPMTFELQGSGGNCNGCEWIAASGEITAETPDAFRAFMADRERLYLYQAVTFDSPGGNLGAAIELGRLLREAQATTAIGRTQPMEDMPQYFEQVPGGACESACVFAFLGGEARWVDGERLGIHQFYTPDGREIPTAATQQIMGQIVMYLIDMGISPEMLTLASRIPGNDMHYLTEDEVARLGIQTSASDSPMRLEVDKGGLVLRWEAMADDGSVDRYQELRCSQGQQAWMVEVLDTGIGQNNFVVVEKDMALTVGGDRHALNEDMIVALRPEGDSHRLTLRLPVDLRPYGGTRLSMNLNDTRNFFEVLSASGTLPDAATLETMVRACGD